MVRSAADDPGTVSFPRDMTMIVVWFGVFGFLALLGVVLPVGFGMTERDEHGLLPVMIFLGFGLTAICLMVVWLLVRALGDPRDPVTISPVGLRVLAVSESVIAWPDISSVSVVVRKGRGISFELTAAARGRVPLRLRARILAPSNRSFGALGYEIPLLDSTATLDRVVDAIKVYKSVDFV